MLAFFFILRCVCGRYPNSIPNECKSKGESCQNRGIRIFDNNDCASCDRETLTECCTFRYEDFPITAEDMRANPDAIVASDLALYIGGMIPEEQVKHRDYYCLGTDTDGGCGTADWQEPCDASVVVDDTDRSQVQRFAV